MKLPFINHRTFVFVLLLTFISLLWLGANPRVRAQGKRLPKRSGHVNDFGEVLDAATKKRLETVLENLKQKAGVDFVIATVKTAGAEDLYDYSLRFASEWNVGAPAGQNKSVLLFVAADSAKFFTQVSKTARADLPEGVIGNMGQRIREKIDSAGFSGGLVIGIQTFVNAVGERNNFTFEALDRQGGGETLIAEQQRPRTVISPAPQPTEPAVVKPTETPTPQAAVTLSPVIAESPQPTATPQASSTPPAQPSETPATVATPTPAASPQATAQASESPATVATATPAESPTAQASPSATSEPTENVASNSARPNKTPATRTTATAPANPENEKEEVELTLTLPADKRIDALKAFIAAHPRSVAVPRANELIIVAHAMLGDQKLQAGDIDGGLQQFRLAISEAPSDMSDRLFTEVIARIPLNLFLRGQREAANNIARQAEALAGRNPKRLLSLAEFYLSVENANEAGRIAELAIQSAPESAAAHQALGAARHIALRLDEAESEYTRALALDSKSPAARVALADLKRATGKTEAALALYREQFKADPKNNSARAGLVLSLFELGRKDEAEQELNSALQDKDQARNLPLLVGAGYWFVAHNDQIRGLELAQKAVTIEPRYSWAQIALARALISNKRPLEAERSLRFVRQYSRFPTLDYELASVLVSIGLYDEAAEELAHSFSLKNGEIETKLAGRKDAHAASFIELLAPERRAAIFQPVAADTESNAKMVKALMTFNAALERPSLNEDDLLPIAQAFIGGNDAMRTYRQIYVAGKFVRNRVALSSVIDLMDQATSGVEAALSVPAATVAVQPDELSDVRARALARGGTPDIPDAPRTALSGLLRGRIEDLAGLALFNLDKSAEAVTRLRRAVSSATEGTPLWRSALWHLGAALEANGKNDQALLYYIKSFVAGPPDPARRSVIENVYKKVNGTLDGLDDKIGPGFAAATATPTPSPTPE